MCQELPFPFTLLPAVPRCACGEPMDHEDERTAGKCWACLAEEAGFSMPAPRPLLPRLTAHQIDALCGVTHRRKSA